MIALFTDYGLSGPYVGQLHAVLQQQVPDVSVIDLMHDAPTFNVKASAYLLAAIISPFAKSTVFCCVVDPGVGSERLPCIVEADGNYFVGPDNGLFNVVVQYSEKVKWHTINWQPENMSNTFHGRDLFAPVAAMLAKGEMPPSQVVNKKTENTDLDYPALIYIDDFGNVMTGIRATSMADSAVLKIAGIKYYFASHFAVVGLGEAFWYRNSLGLVELAVNSGRADLLPGMEPGERVEVL